MGRQTGFKGQIDNIQQTHKWVPVRFFNRLISKGKILPIGRVYIIPANAICVIWYDARANKSKSSIWAPVIHISCIHKRAG
jgi:hypothetical protein